MRGMYSPASRFRVYLVRMMPLSCRHFYRGHAVEMLPATQPPLPGDYSWHRIVPSDLGSVRIPSAMSWHFGLPLIIVRK